MIGGVSGYSNTAQMQQMQQAKHEERFSKADVNGDASIDADEFLALHEGDERSSELFSKIDSDGDGGLTDSEMKDFAEDMRSNMEFMMSSANGKMGGMRPDGPPLGGGKGKPDGPPPGGGAGQMESTGSISGAQLLKMLEAYNTDETESIDEVTEADLLAEYLETLEESEEESTDSVSDSLEMLI